MLVVFRDIITDIKQCNLSFAGVSQVTEAKVLLLCVLNIYSHMRKIIERYGPIMSVHLRACSLSSTTGPNLE